MSHDEVGAAESQSLWQTCLSQISVIMNDTISTHECNQMPRPNGALSHFHMKKIGAFM